MATLTARIEHFVRWFLNSSPDQKSIEARPAAPVAVKKAKDPERSRLTEKRRKGPQRQAATGAAKRVGP